MAVTHRPTLRDVLCAMTTALVDQGTTRATGRVVFFDTLDNVIAIVTLSNPAFGGPSAGIAQANAMIADDNPTANATPVRFEVQDRDGVWVWRGACGPTGDIVDNGEPIPDGIPLRIDTLYYRAPL